MRNLQPCVWLAAYWLFMTSVTPAAEPDLRDIEYARVDDHRLLLDLYFPESKTRRPVVVWIHGGAWRRGSKDNMPLTDLVEHGFCVASVDYRLSPVARFPAQIHDCKAALRFLRANSQEFGLATDRIGVAGSSAGGHLAALVGVSNRHLQLEGTVGDHLDERSDVHAIVDLYGPTNFATILPQSTPHGLSVRVPALKLLLGGLPTEYPKLAKLASPVTHVDDRDPPLLLLHGDQDPQVPINQSHELHAKYKAHRQEVKFEVVHGAAHGGPSFFDQRRRALIRNFFRQHLTN